MDKGGQCILVVGAGGVIRFSIAKAFANAGWY